MVVVVRVGSVIAPTGPCGLLSFGVCWPQFRGSTLPGVGVVLGWVGAGVGACSSDSSNALILEMLMY